MCIIFANILQLVSWCSGDGDHGLGVQFHEAGHLASMRKASGFISSTQGERVECTV